MIISSVGKILVVDDEVELKNILVEVLTSQGYETTGFSSGEEALALLQTQAFDILLTDLMMPGIDGITMVRDGLRIDPHLVAIVMTGQGTIQTAVDAMKVGAFDYVLKPFRLQTVLPVLTRAMNTRHMRLENLQLRETVAIYELGQTIAFTLDPQTVISKLADAALQQTDADEVSVLLPVGGDSEELYVAAVRGENRLRLLGERVPLEQTISGWVARERQPLSLEGEVRDPRFQAVWPHPGIRFSVSIPMQVANKLVGTININALTRPRPFTLGQMKALSILASTAAAALESASLYKQLQEAERKYRSIFENAVEGLFQSSFAGRFLTANPAFARILGYESPPEMIASITDIGTQLYVDPQARAEAARLEAEGGVLQGFEFEAYQKDGSRIWLSQNRRTVLDKEGGSSYLEGSIEDITERKRAEAEQARLNAEIKQQTDRLNTIVATVPGVVFEVSGSPGELEKNKTNFVSEYIGPMLGYTVSEWLALPGFWLSIVHPDDRKRVFDEASKEFSSGQRGGHEFRWIGKDGRIVWVRAHTIVVRDEDGAPIGVRGVVTDISEEKQVEETLRETLRSKAESLALLDTILSSAPVGFAFYNRDLEYERINDTLANINGLPAEEHLGRKVRDVMPELAPALEPHLEQVLKTGEPVIDFELSGESPADPGHQRHWMVSFYPVRMRGGEILGVGVLVSDITDRKRAERELIKSEERYRDLVENAHDIIYMQDLNGRYTSMNKAGAKITGYTVAEALELNINQTVAPEFLPKAREMLSRKLAGENVTAYEMEILAKDGHRITVEANTKLVFQDGVAVGVQGIARDVTERKQLEDQLRQSQKMEAIGQLAGGVAHDFNNLLTAINGYSSLALQRLDDDHPVKDYIQEVKKAGDRAANLTRQLLAFGRKQILQPVEINLNDVVTDLNKMLRRLIGEDITLTAKLDSSLDRIKADPGQIEQVLVNLVVNARDAMPRGGQLTIETFKSELDDQYASRHIGVIPGDYITLAVSDTGTGMDDETKARIFDPFFTTKEKGKGTGLGLSTVYGIVNQSGGSIWVYSEVGQGTTFKIYLPAVAPSTPKLATMTPELAIPGGTETILLVEDEEVVRGLARKILEHAGYQVLEASRGEEAVRLYRERTEPVDLLLTDVVMPGLSGKEVADRLHQMQPDLRVLFMSGYTDDAIVHHGILDSNLEFIQKPFTPAAMAKKVRAVLDAELVPGGQVSVPQLSSHPKLEKGEGY